MMKEDYISQIIEYFRELKSLWESEHKKEIEEKNHNTTKNFSTLSIILTFLLLILTFTNILFNGIAYSSQQVSDANNLINTPEIKGVINNTSQNMNLTASTLSFKSTSITFVASIISMVSYLFFGIILIFTIFMIITAFQESKRYKSISKVGLEIINFEKIITLLYSIKIKYPHKINEKEIKESLFLFDKLEFEIYYHKLKEIVAKLENEKIKGR